MSDKPKHSPGPWRWTWHTRSLFDAEGCGIAYVDVMPRDADARLIAAAPELLNALKVMIELAGVELKQLAKGTKREPVVEGATRAAHALIRRVEEGS